LLAWIFDRKQRRRLHESEAFLSESHCPRCAATYGAESARIARIGEPPPTDCISDSFGYWAVRCPACGAQSLFHSITHEFMVLRSS
jgi:hypothetical protein